jgi:hypothetical protein
MAIVGISEFRFGFALLYGADPCELGKLDGGFSSAESSAGAAVPDIYS